MEVQLRPARVRVHPLLRRGVGYIQPPDCTPSFPGAIPDPACIALQAQVQQANMAEHDEAQRQIFLADCNNNWATNDAQYQALGLPRPVNNCALIYPVGSGGAASPTPIPVTYMTPTAQPPVNAVGLRGGQVTFQNLTTGNASRLNIGDQWRISITGASPNTQVVVRGGQNGQVATTPMGNTDSSGNFSVSGTITADQVGVWQQAWFVSSAPSGSFGFTVVAPQAPPPSGGQQQQQNQQIDDSGGSQQNTGDGSPAGFFSESVDIGGFEIPMVALLGGAAVLLFLFMGRK